MPTQTPVSLGHAPSALIAYDIETIAPQSPDGSFPPWPTHRPVAIGFAAARRERDEWHFKFDALVSADEAEIVCEANRRFTDPQTIVSYNGRGFDALVLRLAAQRQRQFGLINLARHASAHRYALEHTDLADLYASYGRKVALAEICSSLGIPVKTSVSGGDVQALWEAGEHDRIADYVLEDAVATLIVHFCWSSAMIGDDTRIASGLSALARHIEQAPALQHLNAFVDAPLTQWARTRAMRADIGAALVRAERKLRQTEDERAFSRP